MRILCDQHVAQRYIDGFRSEPGFEVATVREVLDPRTEDVDIAAFAAAHDYVIFSNDDDFFELVDDCGLLWYSQWDPHTVGEVLAAVRAIADAYTDHSEIFEVVPGEWV